jgi:hypothetical protein
MAIVSIVTAGLVSSAVAASATTAPGQVLAQDGGTTGRGPATTGPPTYTPARPQTSLPPAAATPLASPPDPPSQVLSESAVDDPGSGGGSGATGTGGGQGSPGGGSDEPSPDRSTVSSALPTQLDLSPSWVAGSAGLGMLLLLLVLAAAQLFNDALKNHHDEIVRALADRTTFLGRAGALIKAIPTPPVLATFAGAAAVLGLIADPSIAFSFNTLAQIVGMMIAIGGIALIYDGTASRIIGRETGLAGRFRLYPLAIAIAVLCLLMSRFLSVSPGVLYGLFVGLAFAGSVSQRLLGRAYAASSAVLILVAVGAFMVHRAVADSAAGASPGFLTIVIDTAAAVLLVGGLQAVIVQLLPTRFVNGENILKWSRIGWLGLLAVAMTLYVVIVVRPNPDEQSFGNLWFVVALVAAALLFWVWATLHHRKLQREGASERPDSERQPAS